MKTTSYSILAALFLGSLSQAAVLTTYSFAGGSLAATNTLGTGGNIALGAAFTADSTNSNLSVNNAALTTFAGSSSNFISFTYTVSGLAAWETLDLTTLSWDYVSAATPGFRFRGSPIVIDNNEELITPTVFPAGSLSTNLVFNTAQQAAATGLVNGSVVTISLGTRVEGGQTGTFTVDNLVLNGTVVVPEPSTALLGAFSAIALLRRRR